MRLLYELRLFIADELIQLVAAILPQPECGRFCNAVLPYLVDELNRTAERWKVKDRWKVNG